MEEKETAENIMHQTMPTEQQVEETHEMVAKDNQEITAEESLKFTQTVNLDIAPPSVRLVNSLFWSNFVSVLLLLVGFVAPGWLTLTTEHQLTYIPSSNSGRTQHIQDVYQDYALWYVTQCYPYDGRNIECETMTYRSIAGVYADGSDSYEKLKISKIENTGDDKFMFHGAALVFGNSKFIQVQTMYTVSLLISLVLLYIWYDLRKEVTKGISKGPGKWNWIFLILLTLLAVILVFVVVFTFVGIRGDIAEYDSELSTPFGLLFSVFGGCLLIVVCVTELIQVLCCMNNP